MGWLNPTFSGAQKRAKMLRYSYILAAPQQKRQYQISIPGGGRWPVLAGADPGWCS